MFLQGHDHERRFFACFTRDGRGPRLKPAICFVVSFVGDVQLDSERGFRRCVSSFCCLRGKASAQYSGQYATHHSKHAPLLVFRRLLVPSGLAVRPMASV